jgi:hypothetical protein
MEPLVGSVTRSSDLVVVAGTENACAADPFAISHPFPSGRDHPLDRAVLVGIVVHRNQ